MNIMVTGATGYVGTALVHKLNELGHDVVEVDIMNTVTWIDVKKTEEIKRLIESHRIEAVIHLAALRSVDTCEKNVSACYKVNTCAAIDLANLCWEHEIRFIFASTMATTILGHTESNHYINSKNIAEDEIKNMENVVVVKPSNIVGAYDGYSFHHHPSLTENIIKTINGQHELKLHGDAVRNFVFIDDVVDAFVEALTTDKEEIRCEGKISTHMEWWIQEFEKALGIRIPYEKLPAKKHESETMNFWYQYQDDAEYFAKILESYKPFISK